MAVTNPGQALGQSSLLLISQKLSTLPVNPPFCTNSFWVACLLALLIGLNLSFLIGALAWFIKITKVIPFESVKLFCKNPFLALYFSLSSSMIFQFLWLLLSAALFMLTIWPFGPPPPRSPTAVEAIQGALFQLEHWLEYWCLPLNPIKCEASFFSVDPHQAHPQPNLLLFHSRLRFNPTPTFCGVTFDRTHFFSTHVSLMKTKFFPCIKALCCISASSCGPSLFSIKLFFGPFHICFTQMISFLKHYQYHQIETPSPNN